MSGLRSATVEEYYADLARDPEASFCPFCQHVTDMGWGNVEYCPTCGWNTLTGRSDDGTAK